MSKEYKLLKKYPSLPKDWEVGMKVGLGDRNYGYSPCAGNYSDCKKLDNSEVENNSEFWEEVKEAILTTFDGVELFKGDNCWFIWLSDPCHGQSINEIYKCKVTPSQKDTFWSPTAVFFSSEISAKEYLKQNEKRYSLNDIKETVKKLGCLGTTLIQHLENEISK